ncbi:MAG: DNA cytosine methyltransferase, partial [Akkermansiaceae bacterium]
MYNVPVNSLSSKGHYSVAEVADICGVSKETVRRWDRAGKLKAERDKKTDYRCYPKEQLKQFEEARYYFESTENDEEEIKPLRDYSLIELFAGGGGLAVGLERCGFKSVLLNEIDKNACETLRMNRPDWNVVEGSISNLCFKQYR